MSTPTQLDVPYDPSPMQVSRATQAAMTGNIP